MSEAWQVSRRELLDQYFKNYGEIDDIRGEAEFGGEELTPAQESRLEQLTAENTALEKRYIEALPYINLSRCPFTGKILNLPMDTYGLDGLWWNTGSPARRYGQWVETFLCLDGAVKLHEVDGKVEGAPFLVNPGPDVPFVIPDLLVRDDVRAVLSQVQIGPHTGYAIAYYSMDPKENPDRTNEWGSNFFHMTDGEGMSRFVDSPYSYLSYDFEIIPWIQEGKLLWIAPGDTALTLRSDLGECPYLELQGRASLQMILDGEVERLSEFEEMSMEEFLENMEDDLDNTEGEPDHE